MGLLAKAERIHKMAAKFVPSHLPNATKPYYLRPVHQEELSIQEAAIKIAANNIGMTAKAIEDGATALLSHAPHLMSEGYWLNLGLIKMYLAIPGEYDGTEEHLPAGRHPIVKVLTLEELRTYVAENIGVEIDGMEAREGHIVEALDEATGVTNDCVTRGNLLMITGAGLKVEWEDATKSMCGVYFDKGDGNVIKATLLAVNEPRTLKIVVPTTLEAGQQYQLRVITQSSPKGSSNLLKDPREMLSSFYLVARN